MARPHGKFAVVDPTDPVAFAQCDRCGKWRNQPDLVWQLAWAGQHLYDIQTLVCKDTCYDKPNEQLRTIVLPPDPPPVIDARPPNLEYEEEGPTQTTLTAAVVRGATVLPVDDTEGFLEGDLVWVQLNNATYGQFPVVDVTESTLIIAFPLSFSAPVNGSVTYAGTTTAFPQGSATVGGTGALAVSATIGFAEEAGLVGVAGLAASVVLVVGVAGTLQGVTSLQGTPRLTVTEGSQLDGSGSLVAEGSV